MLNLKGDKRFAGCRILPGAQNVVWPVQIFQQEAGEAAAACRRQGEYGGGGSSSSSHRCAEGGSRSGRHDCGENSGGATGG